MRHDMTDPTTVPDDVREAAWTAALEALADVLDRSGFPLDPLAQLELVDRSLAAVAEGLDIPPVH
jgi:hypothetical protein